MAERTELLESALDGMAEGIALADRTGRMVLWNGAAETITGFASAEIAGRGVRATLDALVEGGAQHWIRQTDAEKSGRGVLVRLRHKVGHDVPVMARMMVLRDGLGARIGTGVVFHPAESIDGACRMGISARTRILERARQSSKTGSRRCMRSFCKAMFPWACCG